jgi:hypothetical protein
VVILLHSGGLDSHIAWLMHPDWKPVYVVHGSGNQHAELGALDTLSKLDPRFGYELVKGNRLIAEPDGHIPYRNMLLLTNALAAYPQASAVAYGALLGEGSGDKSRRFVKRLERTYRASEGRRVRVLTPLSRLTKAQALRRGLDLPGGDHLATTISCYHGNGCGHCQACFRRGIAEYLCGLRSTPPELPTETKGVAATLRANKLTRWPSLALSNVDVLRAYVKAR